MALFDVSLTGVAEVYAQVEAEDEEEAIDKVFEMKPTDLLCAHCSGWITPYRLSVPDDDACWTPTATEAKPS